MNKRPSMAFGVPSTPLMTPMTAMMTISISVKPMMMPPILLRLRM